MSLALDGPVSHSHPPAAATSNRGYWTLFAANLTQNLGEAGMQVMLPLLALRETSDPLTLGSLTGAGALGGLSFGLVATRFVDSVDRRRLAIAASTCAALGVGAFLTSQVLHKTGLWPLYTLAFFWSAMASVRGPASMAIMQTVVPLHELSRRYSYYIAAEHLIHVVTKPVFSALLAASLLAGITWVATATLLATAVLTLLPRRPYLAVQAELPATVSLRDVLAFVAAHRGLRALLGLEAIAYVVIGGLLGLLALYARTRLGMTEVHYGSLLAVLPLGGALGALSAPRLLTYWPASRVLVAATLGLALVAAGLGLTTSVMVAAPLLFAAAAFVLAYGGIVQPVLQAVVPNAMYGRVRIVFSTVASIGSPLGALGTGALASATSLPLAWQFAAALAVGGCLAFGRALSGLNDASRQTLGDTL